MNSFSLHAEFEYLSIMQQTTEATQHSRAGEQCLVELTSHVKNYDNVVGVLCCYKAPAWTVVEQSHARQFARYSSDFHKNRLWVGELKMLEERRAECYGRNIFLGMQLLPAWPPSVSSHGTSGLA